MSTNKFRLRGMVSRPSVPKAFRGAVPLFYKNVQGVLMIRYISASDVENAVRDLFIRANHELSKDVQLALENASLYESDHRASSVINRLSENAVVAKELGIPICQDTGMAVVFADVGEDVHITDATLEEAVNRGVCRAYIEGCMRLSIVSDPLYERKNTESNTPAILHIRSVKGDRLRIVAAPKGFGSENMSALKMMTPAATEDDVASFIVDSVRRAGSNPCPPIVVGVGIGADFEGVALLAKRALLREIGSSNHHPAYAALEKKILSLINDLNIGPQGFGGKTTALAVHIEYAPTHIAGLPVAMNINCHVARHAEIIL